LALYVLNNGKQARDAMMELDNRHLLYFGKKETY